MIKYPSIDDDPGFEEWHAPNVPGGKDGKEIPWNLKKVFADLQRWKYTGCSEKVMLRL